MRRITAVAVALFASVAMLGLGACSSSEDSATDQLSSDAKTTDQSSDAKTGSGEVAKTPKLSGDAAGLGDAMVASMTSDESMPLTEEQARCYVNRSIDLIGADRFKEAGITGDSLDDEVFDYSSMKISEVEANKVYDQFEACGINLRETMMAGFAEDEEMSAESKACFEEALTGDSLREFMVAGMKDGADALNQTEDGLMGKIMACAFLDVDASDFDLGDSESPFED